MKLSKQEQLQKLQEAQDMASVMGTAAGRRVMWRIINATGHAHQSYVSADAMGTAFNEGRRSIGIVVLRELRQKHAQLYLEMFLEAARDDVALQAEIERQAALKQDAEQS